MWSEESFLIPFDCLPKFLQVFPLGHIIMYYIQHIYIPTTCLNFSVINFSYVSNCLGKQTCTTCPCPSSLARSMHLLPGWWDLEDKVSTPRQTANGCVYRGMGEIQRGKQNDLCEMKR